MSAGDAEALASFFAQDSPETCGSGSAQSTAVSASRTDEHGLHFFRGMALEGRSDSFFFRPLRVNTEQNAEERDVFERCAAGCLNLGEGALPCVLRLDSNWDKTPVIACLGLSC
eukprot:2169482-Prymnesium_polylepis.1